MTSRERINRVARGEIPDRVPIWPDAVFYLPMRLRYDTYNAVRWPTLEDKLACSEYYGFEKVVCLAAPAAGSVKTESRTWQEGETKHYETVYHTRGGKRVSHRIHPADDAAWSVSQLAESIDEVPELLDIIEIEENSRVIAQQVSRRNYLGEDVCVMGYAPDPLGVYLNWRGLQGGITDLIDHPEWVEEILDRIVEVSLRHVRLAACAGLDGLFIGSDGLSLLSPSIMRRFTFPYLKKIAHEAHDAELWVVAHHHGLISRVLEDCADYGVDVLNPLERPPTGDVDLADAKTRIGDRVGLMGNVGTVTTLLNGTLDDVRNQVKECMDAAKDGGRFILSTSDQIARDTPTENIRAFVRAGMEFGRYWPIHACCTAKRQKHAEGK